MMSLEDVEKIMDDTQDAIEYQKVWDWGIPFSIRSDVVVCSKSTSSSDRICRKKTKTKC